jgi:hypothetical protein
VNGEVEEERSNRKLQASWIATVADQAIRLRRWLRANQLGGRLCVIRPVNDVAVLAEDDYSVVGAPVGEARSGDSLGQTHGQDRALAPTVFPYPLCS